MIGVTHRQSEQALRDLAVILLFWDTGMRREELTRLDVRDVLDGERMATRARVRGKFDKERLVELHPQTQRALQHYLNDQRRPMTVDEPLFLGRDGERLTPNAVTLLVKREARRAGLSSVRLTPPTFRSGFARAYLEQEGARIDDLQILMGRASVQMTLAYAGQAAATARRGQRTHAPVALLNLSLGKRLQRGRPRKAR